MGNGVEVGVTDKYGIPSENDSDQRICEMQINISRKDNHE